MSQRGLDGVSGFSLIETMIATLVLTVGLLALSALIHGLGRRTRSSEQIIDLDLRARSAVESLRSVGYTGLSVGRSVSAGSEIRIWNDSPGLWEVMVVAWDTTVGVERADTLATRLGGR